MRGVYILLLIVGLANQIAHIDGQSGQSLFEAFLRRLVNNRTTPRPVLPAAPTATPFPRRVTAANSPSAGLTASGLAAMSEEFAELYRQDDSKISKFVQLGFHICVGGCDGCINLNDSSNVGLIPHYRELRSMYSKWENVTSLADYAVISAYEALKSGVRKTSNVCNSAPCFIDIPFTSGRRTCENPDNPPKPEFPKGEDITSPQKMVREPFNLSQEEMVALLGCHSLGRAHSAFSGFDGPWDLTPTVLDNGYFQALTRVTWSQRFMPEARANQWIGTTRSGESLMMLHADMILHKRFRVRRSRQNRASCTTSQRCSSARTTSRIVQRFSDDNLQFIRALGRAFVKMCNTANFDLTILQQFEFD